jgi:hypothetical protein
MAARDDEVRSKLGRIRDRKGRKTISYITRVLRTAEKAIGAAGRSRRSRFTGARIGRGRAHGSIATLRSRSAGRRRVIVKTRVVRLKGADLGAARAHLRYLQRDGVTREGQPGELYDAASDETDGKAFLERSGGDRHQFRFIVSAEDGTELNDLKPFVRDLMRQMKHDLATRLECEARLGRRRPSQYRPGQVCHGETNRSVVSEGLASRSMRWASVVSAPAIFDRTHAMSGVARSALARPRRRAAASLSPVARRCRAAPASPSLVRAICLIFPKSARQRRQTSPTVSCARQIGQCSTAHVSR